MLLTMQPLAFVGHIHYVAEIFGRKIYTVVV
jgi:hypothetical protein